MWRDHSVVVRGATIEAVLPRAEAERQFPTAAVVALPGQVLIPGLVNTHTHAAKTLLRGYADDLPLLEWLEQRIWPAEARWVDDGFVADGTRFACWEMLTGGTTAFNDMYFYPSAAAREGVRAGMRVTAGVLYLEVATGYASSEREYLERGLAAVEEWRGHERAQFMLAPHSTYATSVDSWENAAALCETQGIGIHTHLNETWGEVERHISHHRIPSVQWLADHQVLSPNFLAAHAVHMTKHDIALAAEYGVTVSHCPSSNLKLASGFAKVQQMLDAGITVGIGTDGTASNNRLDMFQEMRTTALLGKGVARDGAALDAHTVLTMATLNGATALGLDHLIGSIEPGKQADLVSVDLTDATSVPMYDVASHLVYVCGRNDVANVWVGGDLVVRDRECLTVSRAEVIANAQQWQERISG